VGRRQGRGVRRRLIADGAGARTGWVLPFTNTFDVAPTIAMIFGLDLPDAEGKPIVGVFTEKGTCSSWQSSRAAHV